GGDGAAAGATESLVGKHLGAAVAARERKPSPAFFTKANALTGVGLAAGALHLLSPFRSLRARRQLHVSLSARYGTVKVSPVFLRSRGRRAPTFDRRARRFPCPSGGSI